MENRFEVCFFYDAPVETRYLASSLWPEEYAIKNDLSRIWGSPRALFTLQRVLVS